MGLRDIKVPKMKFKKMKMDRYHLPTRCQAPP